jgi:hypothetical protein
MKRPRPHVPLSVCIQVAGRQIVEHGILAKVQLMVLELSPTPRILLALMLSALFDKEPVHLDHDPPLRVRAFNEKTGEYDPPANSPDHLVYRTAAAHRFKTNVRGEGAQYPDRVLILRARRRDKPKRKRSRKIPSRPFPKVHRPFRSM